MLSVCSTHFPIQLSISIGGRHMDGWGNGGVGHRLCGKKQFLFTRGLRWIHRLQSLSSFVD